jgi:hypothetical protein
MCRLLPEAGKYTKKKILKTPKRSHQPIENKGRDLQNDPKTNPNEANRIGTRD